MVLKNKGQYFAGVDGLRALAVVAVLIYHFMPSWLPGGFIGVDIFFVISGFLITTLLVNENAKKKRIDFRNFWARRARRLLPALLALVGLISTAALFVGGDILVGIGRQILGALTFSSNWLEIVHGSNYFDSTSLHLFTNLWSLAVEEQFYLLWPFAVAWMTKVFHKTSSVPMWLCFLLAAASAWLMSAMFADQSATRVYYGTDTHVFGLMLGSATAFWLFARNSVRPVRVWSARKIIFVRRLGLVALAGIIFAMLRLSDISPATYHGGLFAVSAATVILLVATISSKGFLQDFFELPVIAWIGLRSYGIYLWHWPLYTIGQFVLPSGTSKIAAAGITTAATFIIAALSYQYIEVPIRDKGIIRALRKSIGIKSVVSKGRVVRKQLLPHPALLVAIVVSVLTVAAVAKAPDRTLAEARVEQGRIAIENTKRKFTEQKSAVDETPNAASTTTPGQITGQYVTIIGDSVTLAAAEELQAKFPGVYIDAAVSRSLYNGFAVIDNLAQGRQLRPIVVIALGTNNYFGDGNLVRLIAKLSERKVVFVTSHTTREWSNSNNTELRTVAVKYPHVRVADWDAAISPHPELLAADSTHPNGRGSQIYAEVIAQAIASVY